MDEPDWTFLSSFLDDIRNPAHSLCLLFKDDAEREAALADAIRSGEVLIRARRVWDAGSGLPPRPIPRGELNAAAKISLDRDELETIAAAGSGRYFAVQVIPAEVERRLRDTARTPKAASGAVRARNPSLNERKRSAVLRAIEKLGRDKLRGLPQKEREARIVGEAAKTDGLAVSDRYARALLRGES